LLRDNGWRLGRLHASLRDRPNPLAIGPIEERRGANDYNGENGSKNGALARHDATLPMAGIVAGHRFVVFPASRLLKATCAATRLD
jgi:hypothetical protein